MIIQLWKGKKVIFFTVWIAIVLEIGYVFLAQDTYISTVVITPPQLGQLADYPVIVEAVAPSKHNNINNAIFANAVSRLSAKALTLRPESSLVIRPLDQGSKYAFIVTSKASTPEDALRILSSILDDTNKEVSSIFYSNINKALQVKIQSINVLLNSLVKTAEDKKSHRLALLTEALKIAEATNIKNIVVNRVKESYNDVMLFMLGAPALKELISNESSWPLYFDDNYYTNCEMIQSLKKFKSNHDGNNHFEAFSYASPPSLAATKVAPRGALTLVLFILLGPLIGVSIVLVKNHLYNAKNKGLIK